MTDSPIVHHDKESLRRKLLQDFQSVQAQYAKQFDGLKFIVPIVELEPLPLDDQLREKLQKYEENKKSHAQVSSSNHEKRNKKEKKEKDRKSSSSPSVSKVNNASMPRKDSSLSLKDKIKKQHPHLVSTKPSTNVPKTNESVKPLQPKKKAQPVKDKTVKVRSFQPSMDLFILSHKKPQPSQFKIPKKTKELPPPTKKDAPKVSEITMRTFQRQNLSVGYASAGDFDMENEPDVSFMDNLLEKMEDPAKIARKAQGLGSPCRRRRSPSPEMIIDDCLQTKSTDVKESFQPEQPVDSAVLPCVSPSTEDAEVLEPEIIVPLETSTCDDIGNVDGDSENTTVSTHDELDYEPDDDEEEDKETSWKRLTSTPIVPSSENAFNSQSKSNVINPMRSDVVNRSPPRHRKELSPPRSPPKDSKQQPVKESRSPPRLINRSPIRCNQSLSSQPAVETRNDSTTFQPPKYLRSMPTSNNSVNSEPIKLSLSLCPGMPLFPSPPRINSSSSSSSATISTHNGADSVHQSLPPKPVDATISRSTPQESLKPAVRAETVRQVISPRDPRIASMKSRSQGVEKLQGITNIGDLFTVRHTGRKFDDIKVDIKLAPSLKPVSIPFTTCQTIRDLRYFPERPLVSFCCPPLFFKETIVHPIDSIPSVDGGLTNGHMNNSTGTPINGLSYSIDCSSSFLDDDDDESKLTPPERKRKPGIFEMLQSDAQLESTVPAKKYRICKRSIIRISSYQVTS